jgi:hypothetical protein
VGTAALPGNQISLPKPSVPGVAPQAGPPSASATISGRAAAPGTPVGKAFNDISGEFGSAAAVGILRYAELDPGKSAPGGFLEGDDGLADREGVEALGGRGRI